MNRTWHIIRLILMAGFSLHHGISAAYFKIPIVDGLVLFALAFLCGYFAKSINTEGDEGENS